MSTDLDPSSAPSSTDDPSAAVDLAVDFWRLHRLMNRMLLRMDAGEGVRFQSQLDYFSERIERTLERLGVRVVNVEGTAYDAGAAVTALNLDEFATDLPLVVDQMIEPLVMGPHGVLRVGTVKLRLGAS